MSVLAFDEFDKLYQCSVQAVCPHLTDELQHRIAAHNRGWDVGRTDFPRYLRSSSMRYYRAYRAVASRRQGGEVCDVGGFWGVFPLTLAAMGLRVAMTEALEYYRGGFESLFDLLRRRGVRVIDYDPFDPAAARPGPFDAVTLMAVLEHYPHSPKALMENVAGMLRPGGIVYVEVPNIAYWPNRLKLLKGHTPLVPVRTVYESDVPFLGHHREYTFQELADLAELAGLRVVRHEFFNYSQEGRPLERWLDRPLSMLAFRLIPQSRECIAAVLERA